MRVRFAPSPTGYLHIGGLRTALYCYLLARRSGGSFVLRIEDTDRGRFVADAEQDILDCLEWTGLLPDEGPVCGGPHAPYRQSERSELYQGFADQLVANGQAYYAFDTTSELEAMRAGGAAGYNAETRLGMRNSLSLSVGEVNGLLRQQVPFVIRLKVPDDGVVRFRDEIRSEVRISTKDIDDQVLMKSDGMPTYHLANVVDDHLMEVTHVVRGEEWLPSTPKHILLYEALGWNPPVMAHLPLILSPTGGKLSKRNAERQGIPVLVRDYRKAGYEPEALINFLVMLGWNPGTDREIYSLQELTECFSLDRVGSSAAQFRMDKLDWFNQNHIRQLPVERLKELLKAELAKQGIEVSEHQLLASINLVADRISRVEDFVTRFRYLFVAPVRYDQTGVRKRWKSDAPRLVRLYAERIDEISSFTEESAESELRALAAEEGVGAGRIIHPVRLAVSGTTRGPSLFALLEVLGAVDCMNRLYRAADKLPSPCD